MNVDVPRRSRKRPAHVKHPPAHADGTQEIHADDVLEALDAAPASARAPAHANATQEIRAEDVLEALDAAPPVEIPIDEEPPLVRLAAPRSIAPVAIEIPAPSSSRAAGLTPRSAPTLLAEITSQLQAWKPPRKFRTIVEVVMALSLLILAAAGVRAHFAAQEPDAPLAAAVDADPAPAARAASPAQVTAPSVDVKSLPSAPTTGTIALGPGARGLTVDNAKISAASAVVPCGGHVVRVGREKPRKVDVPCGGTLVASPGGRFVTR